MTDYYTDHALANDISFYAGFMPVYEELTETQKQLVRLLATRSYYTELLVKMYEGVPPLTDQDQIVEYMPGFTQDIEHFVETGISPNGLDLLFILEEHIDNSITIGSVSELYKRCRESYQEKLDQDVDDLQDSENETKARLVENRSDEDRARIHQWMAALREDVEHDRQDITRLENEMLQQFPELSRELGERSMLEAAERQNRRMGTTDRMGLA